MPQALILKPELAEAVRQMMDGISISQAAYKTGVSYEWMRRIVQYGHVPSEEVLSRIAKGLHGDLQKLRIAAGYEEESDPVRATRATLRRTIAKLAQDAEDRVLAIVKEITETPDRMSE